MTQHMVRRAVSILGSGVLALIIVADWTGAAAAQGASTPSASSELEILQVRPDFYMIAGAGGNVAVQTGPDGTVVVDAGSADRADALLAAIRKITRTPIRYVINTGAEPDHVGGNVKVSEAGDELTKAYGIPQVAALGGAATMYPEFRKTIKDQFVRPEKCPAACAPGGGNQLRFSARATFPGNHVRPCTVCARTSKALSGPAATQMPRHERSARGDIACRKRGPSPAGRRRVGGRQCVPRGEHLLHELSEEGKVT